MIKSKLAMTLSIIMLISTIGITYSNADETIQAINTQESKEISETVTAINETNIATASTASLKNNISPTAAEDGSVIFVAKDNEKTVKFSSLDEAINKTDDNGNKGDDQDKGGGATKAYFLFWSNIPNYKGTPEQIAAGAKAFYKNEPLRNAFPDGLPNEKKLYATYMDVSTAMYFSSSIKGEISINKYINNSQTMYDRFEVKENSENTYYVPNELSDTNPIQLGSEFLLNPFVNAFIRYSPSHFFQPGSAQYYGKRGDDRTSTSPNVKETEYTFVDIHVKIDPRVQLNNDIIFKFKSYSFKPHMILTKDYQKIDNAAFNIQNGNPESDISFSTTGMNFAPNETKHFILRTVMRGQEEIPEPSFEDSNTHDLRLITSSENNFTVSKEEIEKIARGEAEPLKIEGEIKGGAFLYSLKLGFFSVGGPKAIPVQKAKPMLLDYKYNKVTFNKNSTALNDQENQNLGSSYVIHGKALENDRLTDIIPNENTVGNSMMTPPSNIVFDGKTYNFSGWNTEADGSGTTFTNLTNVTEDITVYAQWRKKLLTVTFVPNYDNKPSFNVSVVPDSSINGDGLNKKDSLTNDDYDMPADLERPAYIFKGWNTALDGNGNTFNADTIVKENITVYGQWKRTTEWVDENSSPLKNIVEDRDVLAAGTIDNYTFVSTENTNTGVKHIFRKNIEIKNQITTQWLDENNSSIKPTVIADTAKEAGTIDGFIYIKTENTNTGVKHIFRKNIDNSLNNIDTNLEKDSSSPNKSISENSSTPSNSSSLDNSSSLASTVHNKSSKNSAGPKTIPSTVVVPTPEPTTVIIANSQKIAAQEKPALNIPKTADRNMIKLWLLSVFASLTGFITLRYNIKRNNI